MTQQAFNPANSNGVKYVDATTEALRVTSVDAAGAAVSPATSANQDTLNTNLGAKADAAATTDTGTFSLIALFKRALQSLTTIGSKLTGAANYANSQVTAGVASGVLVAARATRRVVTIRNQDAANSAYIGGGGHVRQRLPAESWRVNLH
ncbi:MAG: hypothetical protein ACJ74Q_21460 [Pyrinomonadaceae bacterium]